MNNYLPKGFYIIEKTPRKLSILPKYAKLRIHAIENLETDFVIKENTEIYSVANTIKKFHIQSDLNFIYKQFFNYDKQYEMDTLSDECHVTLLNDLDHSTLIEEWKRNIDDATYFFLNKGIKLP